MSVEVLALSTPASTPPEINFSSQTPVDINTYNVVGTALNLTYNISANGTGRSLNTSAIWLWHKTNSTTSDCWYYVNGTQKCGWTNTEVQTSNVSNVWQFLLKDNAIYPATYNIDQPYMESTAKSVQNIDNQNDYFKIRLYNVSATRQYGFFEAYANATSGTNPLRIYYCNSSYTTGLMATSTNCAQLSAIVASSSYNHSHTTNSWHYVAPFGINTTAGTINGIKVTPTSYFLLRGNTGTDWGVYYISNVSDANAMQTSGNGGNSWSNFAGTADAHLHQFNGNDTFRYFVQACDNATPTNECTNSSVRSDLMELGGMPPTAPYVYSPAFNSSYLNNSLININYTESISPNAYNISYYNITLRNANLSYNKTIYANNSQNLSYVWDSTGTLAGEYVIGVEAKDQNNQTTIGYSGEFSLVAVSTCGTITSNTTLNTNLVSVGSCISIGASHITLDCNGFSLTGYGISIGIYGYNLHEVTIANCFVYNYNQGVYLDSFTAGFIYNLTSNDNLDDGLMMEYPSSNILDNVTLNNNGDYGGVMTYSSNPSTFTNFVTNNNTIIGFGIRQGYNYGNKLINFTSVNNSDTGLLLDNSPNTIVVNVNASGNKNNGAYVAVGSSIVYLNDSVFHNNSVGMRYLTSSGMNANNLTISNNSLYGLSFYYTSNTLTLSNSSILNSGLYDLFFEETPTGNHVLLNTTFNSSKIGYYHCDVNCNFTSKWYARVNVSNSTDQLPADVNDSDALGNRAYSATLGASGLSPWFIVNDTIYSGAGNTVFNPHSINASYTRYFINSSSFNFSWRDYTLNLTLYPYPSCGTIIVDTTLVDDLTSSGTCITIGANDITLNCNGHNINGGRTVSTYGAYASAYTNVTVKNCNITNFGIGVYFISAHNSFVINTTSYSNSYSGIGLSSSTNNTLSYITTNNNSNRGTGITLNSNNNTLGNITANNNTYGIVLSGTSNSNTLSNIAIDNNTDRGIYFESNSNSNTLINITANNNTYGIFLSANSNTTIANSTISDSTTADIYSRTNAQNNTLLNVSFNSSKIVFGTCTTTCNFTVQWYTRLNVTNSTGDALPAGVNDTDAQGNRAYSATLGAGGLSPWFIVNDTIYSGAGNTAFNPHSINASYTGYAINMSTYNFSGRDYTFNISLYEPITITFIPPTPNNGATVYGHNLTFAIISSGALTNATLSIGGVSYWMFMDSPTLWTLGLGSVPYGLYYFNVTGQVQSSVNVTSATRVIRLEEYPKGTFTMNNSAPLYSATMSITGNATLVNYTGFTVNMSCTNPLGTVTNLTVTGGPLLYLGSYIATYMGNYSCQGSAINDTYELHNSTSFEVFCPLGYTIIISNRCYIPLTSVGLNATTVQKYVEIGDYFYLKVTLPRNITFNSMYAYSADGTPTPFTYVVAGGYWYVGYQVRQKAEMVVIQTFDVAGTANGYGTYDLRYNPKPVAAGLSLSLGSVVIYGAIALFLILAAIAIVMIYGAAKSYTRQPSQITPQLKPSHGGAIGRTFGTAHLIIGVAMLVVIAIGLVILYLLATWVLRYLGLI